MPANRYKVPMKNWNKWTEDARALFNELFGSMRDQALYSHPKATPQARAHWETTRWNAAWMAAHELSVRQKQDDHPAIIATKTLAAVVLTMEGKRHKWSPQERRGYNQLVRQLGLKKAA